MAYGESEDDAIVMGPVEGKASESVLADLHGVVAEYLKLKLLSGKATAAEVGAAITFLKNNNITADPATNERLRGLSQTLQNRKKGGRLSPQAAAEAEDHFQALMGGMGMQ